MLDHLKSMIPSVEALKQMMKMNRSSAFTALGARTFRIVGALVVIIGLLVFGGGLGMARVSQSTSAFYEQIAGRSIKAAPAADKPYAERAGTLLKMSRLFKTISYFIVMLGIFILKKPAILYYELKRFGFDKEFNFQRESQKSARTMDDDWQEAKQTAIAEQLKPAENKPPKPPKKVPPPSDEDPRSRAIDGLKL